MYYLNRANLPTDGYYLKISVMKNNISDHFMVKAPSENPKEVLKKMIAELRIIKKSENMDFDEYLDVFCNSKYFKTAWEFDDNNEPCKLLGYSVYYYKDGIGYSINKL